MKKVFITGITGFVGSHVADALLQHDYAVFGMDDYSTGRYENNTYVNGLTISNDSILYKDRLNLLFEHTKPDAVIHLAAQSAISTSIADPIRDLEVNGIGTLNVLQAALKYGVKRFVFASTSAVYKHVDYSPIVHDEISIRENRALGPDTPYGISKLAAEGYVRTLFPFSTILRFGNVIGSRQVPIGENQVLSRMIRHFKYGDKFYIHGSGHQKRDFIYVSDVASAVIAALDGEPGTYNVASGEAHSVDEMAQIVELAYGVPGYKWDHTEQEDPRAYVCLDITSAKQGLRWEPKVKFEQAVNNTIDWWEGQK